MEQERQNPFPACPECDGETYVTIGDDEHDNVWCYECEWFTEVDK